MEPVVNKRRQYEAAQNGGIPIPETYFPESRSDVEQLAATIHNYPYIIKPLVAHTWRLASMQGVSQGRKAVLVRNAQELCDAHASMGDGFRDVMLQEVIGGRDEQLFTFLGYLSQNGTPLAYCVRRKIRQLPIDFGYCTMTVSCHDDVVVRQSLRLLQGIGFSGICGVEYKFDAVSGEYKLIEINPRPVNTIGLAAGLRRRHPLHCLPRPRRRSRRTGHHLARRRDLVPALRGPHGSQAIGRQGRPFVLRMVAFPARPQDRGRDAGTTGVPPGTIIAT